MVKIEYIAVLLTALIIFQNIMFAKERKELLNRIMARDFDQFKTTDLSRSPPKSRGTIDFGEGGD